MPSPRKLVSIQHTDAACGGGGGRNQAEHTQKKKGTEMLPKVTKKDTVIKMTFVERTE